MEGLGSAMKTHLLRATIAVACGVLLYGAAAVAGGVTLGVPIYTLDLSGTLGRIPIAVDGAFTALEGALIDSGVPPADLEEVRDRIDETLDQIDDFARAFPPLLPIPLVGGTIEVSLPLIVVDSVRFTGGLVSDGLLRGVARLAGTEIPQPLFDAAFESEGFSGAATIDVAFSSWMLSTDVVKRFDLLILALTLGGGVDLLRGEIRPLADIDVPLEFEDGVTDALAALRLDELIWSTFAVHGVVGFEIGPPFLRIYADVRFLLPLSEAANWWDLRSGGLAAVLGVVIRF